VTTFTEARAQFAAVNIASGSNLTLGARV
jgi:hypothetical protein